MSTSLQNISVKYMDLLSEIETGQENTNFRGNLFGA
jgi:hypothetical protein